MCKYLYKYRTPEGFDDIVLIGNEEKPTSLLFENITVAKTIERYEFISVTSPYLSVFSEVREWLDLYFNGEIPAFTPSLSVNIGTPFFNAVMNEVSSIPYGHTLTYGEIAKRIAEKNGIDKMSAQAVGTAVGKNPFCIIIPCHRVIAANNKIGGYSGGLNNKISLLKLEKITNIRQ